MWQLPHSADVLMCSPKRGVMPERILHRQGHDFFVRAVDDVRRIHFELAGEGVRLSQVLLLTIR